MIRGVTNHAPAALTRVQAARLLRAARAAVRDGAENADEVVGWALSAMRDNRHATRLKIELLLDAGQFDAADAIMGRRLLRLDEHPLMRMRFVRSLWLQGRLEQAFDEIARVIGSRPRHVGALRLGGAIAARLGRHDEAATWMVMALDERPADSSIREELIAVLLAAGLVFQARMMLCGWNRLPALAHASVLMAEGCPADAVAILRGAPRDGSEAQSRRLDQALLAALLTSGDLPAAAELVRTSPKLAAADPLGAARALLRGADASGALALLERACSESASPLVHAAIMAIAGSNGDRDRARQSLDRLRSLPRSARTRFGTTETTEENLSPEIATWWLDGLFERLMAEQADGRLAGSDPSSSVIEPLIRRAIDVLDETSGGPADPALSLTRAAMRRQCLAVLGNDPACGRQAA